MMSKTATGRATRQLMIVPVSDAKAQQIAKSRLIVAPLGNSIHKTYRAINKAHSAQCMQRAASLVA